MDGKERNDPLLYRERDLSTERLVYKSIPERERERERQTETETERQRQRDRERRFRNVNLSELVFLAQSTTIYYGLYQC